MRLTVSALIGITIFTAPHYGSSPTLRPVEMPWTGSARCQLDIRGPGYTAPDYVCMLSGFSQSLQRWSPFGDSLTLPVQFRLSPAPANITGTFTW